MRLWAQNSGLPNLSSKNMIVVQIFFRLSFRTLKHVIVSDAVHWQAQGLWELRIMEIQTYLEHEELWASVFGMETDTKKVTKAGRKSFYLLIRWTMFMFRIQKHIQRSTGELGSWFSGLMSDKTLVYFIP